MKTKMERPPEVKKIEVDLELFKGNDWSLPTDIGLLNYAEKAFENKLTETGWDEDESFGLLLSFREALINAIAHGNLGILKKIHDEDLSTTAKREQVIHPTNKKIYITFEISKNRVMVRMRDEGNGFKHDEVPDPTQTEGLLQAKGRGLYLMENCYDSVTFNEKGNEVTMIKLKEEKKE